jgi:hypothetical protein
MADVRIYFVIHAATASAPTENQWRTVLADAVQQPGTLARAIQQQATKAQNYLSGNKRSQNPAQLRRYTLVGFEIDSDLVDDALSLLNAIAATRGIAGTARQKFEAVLQAELRESAVRQGFSGAQAALIDVAIVGYGDRDAAIAAGQAYMAANASIWYDPAAL